MLKRPPWTMCTHVLRRLCAGPTMEQRAPSNGCPVMLETILIFDAWIEVYPTMSGNPREGDGEGAPIVPVM